MGSFELVWASTWGLKVNDSVARILGLPRLLLSPCRHYLVMEHGSSVMYPCSSQGALQRGLMTSSTKMLTIGRGGARSRPLLVLSATYVGLRSEHVTLLKEFAASLA